VSIKTPREDPLAKPGVLFLAARVTLAVRSFAGNLTKGLVEKPCLMGRELRAVTGRGRGMTPRHLTIASLRSWAGCPTSLARRRLRGRDSRGQVTAPVGEI